MDGDAVMEPQVVESPELDQEIEVDEHGELSPAAPPAPSRFKVGDLEFDSEAEAASYLGRLNAEAETYRNSRAVQEARAKELQEQAAREEQERQYLAAYQQATEVVLKDIAAGRPEQGIAKLMDFSTRLTEHRMAQQFQGKLDQLVQQRIDAALSPIMFERAQGIEDIKDFQEEALFLEKNTGWPKPAIVEFLRAVRAKAQPKDQKARLHIAGSDGGSAPATTEDRKARKEATAAAIKLFGL